MQVVLSGGVMLLMVLIGVPGDAAKRLVPYDDFNATSINPDRWFGGEFSSVFPRWGAEAIRQIQDNQLRLMYRSYGVTNTVGGTNRSELALMIRNSAFVTAMQAAVTVTDAVALGCHGSVEHTVARVAIGGRFFGSAASTPNGEVRDMVVFIGIERVSYATDPPDVFRAKSLVFYCANRPCTVGKTLHVQDLGTVMRGETARLRVEWDRVHGQFIFQRDEQPEVFAKYAVSGIVAPAIPAKVLNAMQFVPDCTATPRPMAVIDALIDDVMVNESAAPRAEP